MSAINKNDPFIKAVAEDTVKAISQFLQGNKVEMSQMLFRILNFYGLEKASVAIDIPGGEHKLYVYFLGDDNSATLMMSDPRRSDMKFLRFAEKMNEDGSRDVDMSENANIANQDEHGVSSDLARAFSEELIRLPRFVELLQKNGFLAK